LKFEQNNVGAKRCEGLKMI